MITDQRTPFWLKRVLPPVVQLGTFVPLGAWEVSYVRGANAAHNPFEVKLPRFISWLECNEDDMVDNSIIMSDDRDLRMVSPFQSWLTREIMSNSASSINVLTERDQECHPVQATTSLCSGVDGIKVVVVALETETGSMNAGWDADTATALSRLSHVAFQPFTCPMLRDTSASYSDLKIYNGNEVLFHWIFRGYRVLVTEANKGKWRSGPHQSDGGRRFSMSSAHRPEKRVYSFFH